MTEKETQKKLEKMGPKPEQGDLRPVRWAGPSVFCLFLGLGLGLIGGPANGGASAAAAPSPTKPLVVASIAPLHVLVREVLGQETTGDGREDGPRLTLLYEGHVSPHSRHLRPSQMRLLQSAALVFWIGPGMENHLAGVLDSLPATISHPSLMRAAGIETLPYRPPSSTVEEDSHDHGDHEDHSEDPHIWLMPDNAAAMARAIAAHLAILDPAGAARYEANAHRIEKDVQKLTRTIEKRLSPLQGVAYGVVHDAFQYFEHAAGLRPPVAILPGHEGRLGPRSLADSLQRLSAAAAPCILIDRRANNQYEELLKTESRRLVRLDPLLPPGMKSWKYSDLLQYIIKEFSTCLSGKGAVDLDP